LGGKANANFIQKVLIMGVIKMWNSSVNEMDQRMWKFSEDWTVVRLVGKMISVYEFWISIRTETGGQTCVRKLCLDWDAVKESRRGSCPYCKAGLRGRPMYYSNAIIRQLQTEETGAAEGASPVRVLKIPPRLHACLSSLASVNKRQSKTSGEWKQYDLAHPKWGRDVRIKIDPATSYSYYKLEPRERSRLSAEERAYPLVPLAIQPESPQQAKAAWRQLKEIVVHEDVST
jgi:hypothetical protein